MMRSEGAAAPRSTRSDGSRPPGRVLVIDDGGRFFARRRAIFGALADRVDVMLVGDFYDAMRPPGRHRSHDWFLGARPDAGRAAAVLSSYRTVIANAVAGYVAEPARAPAAGAAGPTGHPQLDRGPLPRPTFAGLDVALAVGQVKQPMRPSLVVFADAMTDPRLAVPLWLYRHAVSARCTTAYLFDGATDGSLPRLRSIARGGRLAGLPAPTPQDWAALGLAHNSPLVDLIVALRERYDIWHRVCFGRHPDHANPQSVSRNVRTRLRSLLCDQRLRVPAVLDLVRAIEFPLPVDPLDRARPPVGARGQAGPDS